MRIAITGASGFVGRHVMLQARALGIDVVGLVRSPGAARSVSDAGATPVQIAGLDAAALEPAFTGARAVVHLAQIGSQTSAASYESVNVQGTRAVAAAARAAGVESVVLLSGLGVAHYGMSRYTTNAYFLSKLSAELSLFRALAGVSVFRPSYIVGPGDGLLSALLPAMQAGAVEIPGDGAYRSQPIAVQDAAAAVLAAVEAAGQAHRVYDLVGPEPIAHRELIARIGRVAQQLGRAATFDIRSLPLAEAVSRAQLAGKSEDLDCLLCDETADARPLEALLGRFLTPLDEALARAVRGTRATAPPA